MTRWILLGAIVAACAGYLAYSATATGNLRAEDGSRAEWFAPDAIPDPHPALRRELFDAGVRADNETAIEASLQRLGIQMLALT